MATTIPPKHGNYRQSHVGGDGPHRGYFSPRGLSLVTPAIRESIVQATSRVSSVSKKAYSRSIESSFLSRGIHPSTTESIFSPKARVPPKRANDPKLNKPCVFSSLQDDHDVEEPASTNFAVLESSFGESLSVSPDAASWTHAKGVENSEEVKNSLYGSLSTIEQEHERATETAPGTLASAPPSLDWTEPNGMEFDSNPSRRFKLRNGREILEERAYLVGIENKNLSRSERSRVFTIKESLDELEQLASTAGLLTIGSTYQRLDSPNPRTYIGMGKVAEIKTLINTLNIETVIFDDELSPGQLRSLGREFGDDVRVCDRTALILDIFSQRAATKEASLQVQLAQLEYQLPRLTRMWTHLERQAGGLVKGMGEKQIEVDKRIIRTRISSLKKDLENVCMHRQQYRERRATLPIPVISLVGYTNAGKSTLMNCLCNSNLLSEDKLFATLDPTTRHVHLPNGKECLFTDTVGFIQKLPTQLVASFRATLEEISESSLLLHVVDISNPMASQQIEAVKNVLADLDVGHIPIIEVWNKIDKVSDPETLTRIVRSAAEKDNVVVISSLSGQGFDSFFSMVQNFLNDRLVMIQAIVPYESGEILNKIYRLGVVEEEKHLDNGTLVRAFVPLSLSRQLHSLRISAALSLMQD